MHQNNIFFIFFKIIFKINTSKHIKKLIFKHALNIQKKKETFVLREDN